MKWFLIPLALLGVGVFLSLQSTFSVYPQSQAVVTRNGEIIRVVGPGLHQRNPLSETVHQYDVLWERQTVLQGPFEIANCPAQVSLIYQIADVVAFHEAGGEDAGFPVSPNRIAAILASVPDTSQTPGNDAALALRDALAATPAGGLEIRRAGVELGACTPQPPRIETRWEAMPSLPTLGQRGTERARPASLRVAIADGSAVEIDGVVLTYDIEDRARFETCFQDAEQARRRLDSVARNTLRVAIGQSPELPLTEAVANWRQAVETLGIEREANCGIRFGAMDFSDARVARLVDINCDETPDEAECVTSALREGPLPLD